MPAPPPIPFTWTPRDDPRDRHLQITKVTPAPGPANATHVHAWYRYGEYGGARALRLTLTPDGFAEREVSDHAPASHILLSSALAWTLTHEHVARFLTHFITVNQTSLRDHAHLLVAALTLPDHARPLAITMLTNGYTGTPEDLRTAALAATAADDLAQHRQQRRARQRTRAHP